METQYTTPNTPFTLAAPSMVYGENLEDNIERLSQRLSHVEIVLFHTPELHNLPDKETVAMLSRLKAEKGLTYSVHLPTSLEIASDDAAKCDRSLRLAAECVAKTAVLAPIHYVLHVPYTPPTLTAVPGLYFKAGEGRDWPQWTERGLKSLERLERELGWRRTLLVENINFSPVYLEPFVAGDFCRLCLDIGHLLLGGEAVRPTIAYFGGRIREIHLHGVSGETDHLGLDVLPRPRVQRWLDALAAAGFEGVMNIEVFSPRDLAASLAVVAGGGPAAAAVHGFAGQEAAPRASAPGCRNSLCHPPSSLSRRT